MKKTALIILITSMCFINLSASSLEDDYNKALSAYKSKDFSTSYELLSKLYLTKLSDIDLNYQLGRSAYETGHYEIALAAFERVEMLGEGNVRNKLEMARTFFMLKMYEESKSAFKEVLENQSIPDNVRKNIELYLAKTSKVQQKSFTYGAAGLDITYDSNINFSSLESDYDTTIGSLPSVEKKDGGALQLFGTVTNIYDIGDKNGYAVKNKFTAFLKRHTNSDNSDYDIGYLAYNPSLLYKETKFTAELELGIESLYLSGDSYLQSFSISPKFDWNHTTTLRSLIHLKYADKNYKKDLQKDLDAKYYELSYGLQKILSPSSYAQATLIGSKERKKHGTRVDVDFNENKLNLNYANQLNSTYGVELFGQLRQRKYKNSNTLFNNTRKDTGKTASISFTAQIMPKLIFKTKAQYSRVNSNQEVYSYNKKTLTIGFIKTF